MSERGNVNPLDFYRPVYIILIMTTKRDEVIDVTCRLFERQGYHATGLNEIIEASGAPKGSLYYYFPAGKEALATAAVARSRAAIAGRIAAVMVEIDDPVDAVVTFIHRLADVVAASGYQGGGPITAVALGAASTSDPLRLACRDAYREWAAVLAAKLRPDWGEETAEQLALTLIAAIEGGIILARSEHSPRPLLAVAGSIETLLRCAGGTIRGTMGRKGNHL
jgi:TetR/AcrR family transcriptional regulator, lmrAB and yxaGH operons repressor